MSALGGKGLEAVVSTGSPALGKRTANAKAPGGVRAAGVRGPGTESGDAGRRREDLRGVLTAPPPYEAPRSLLRNRSDQRA